MFFVKFRDCITGDSRISLANGTCVRLDSLIHSNSVVLGWDEKMNGLIKSNQTHFMDKGKKECVELMLEDGRRIKVTENHPFLTSENEWVLAKDLVIGKTKLKVGVENTFVNMEADFKACENWKLEIGELKLDGNNRQDVLKALAFARIIGWVTEDGTVYDSSKSVLFLENDLDVDAVKVDLELLGFTDYSLKKIDSVAGTFNMTLPKKLAKIISESEGVMKGRKTIQKSDIPAFIIDPTCPVPVIREFLASIMGANGHAPILGLHRGKRDIITPISYSRMKTEEHISSYIDTLNCLRELFAKCGITGVSLQKSKDVPSYNFKRVVLHIELSEMRLFAENVGFRYCVHKSQRLWAAVTYMRFREEVTRQHNWVIDRVEELTSFSELYRQMKESGEKKNFKIQKEIDQAHRELRQKEGILNDYYSLPHRHWICERLKLNNQLRNFKTKYFPTPEEFFRKIGALEYFLNEADPKKPVTCCIPRGQIYLPTFNLTVLHRKPAGIQQVYDITVEDTHSFLANGIVVHNCLIGYAAAGVLYERLFFSSDRSLYHVCAVCGYSAVANMKEEYYVCKFCNNDQSVRKVLLPHAFQVFLQEQMSVGVSIRLQTSDPFAESESPIFEEEEQEEIF